MAFTYNPYSANQIFGTTPAQIPTPTPAADLAAQIPGLSNLNSTLSGDIQNQLSGQLSPQTIQAIQNAAATFGVQSGMPGIQPGTLSGNLGLRNIGLSTEQVQQQGIQNYNQTIPTIAGTQTVTPSQQIALGQINTTNAAEPTPAAAQSYAQNLFNQYMQMVRGPGGGTGGGQVNQGFGGNGQTRFGMPGDPFTSSADTGFGMSSNYYGGGSSAPLANVSFDNGSYFPAENPALIEN